MMRTYKLFERSIARALRFDDQQHLVSPLDLPFPGIDGPHAGHDIDTRRQALLHHILRKLLGDVLRRGRDKDDAQLFVCHGSTSPGNMLTLPQRLQIRLLDLNRIHEPARDPVALKHRVNVMLPNVNYMMAPQIAEQYFERLPY